MSKYWFLAVGLGLMTLPALSQNVAFEEAISQKSLTVVSAKGNPESTHYIKPLLMTLKNMLNKPLSVVLKAGTYFVSEPAEYQDITITAEEIIAFKPNESRTLALSGVCTEPSNAAPGQNTAYTIGAIPNQDYAEFAKFVSVEKLYHTSEAQTGMWFLCKGGDELALIDQLQGCSHKSVYEKIFQKLCDIKKLKLRIVNTETKTATALEYKTQYFNGDKLLKEYVNTDPIIGEKKYQVSINGKTHSEYSYTLTGSKPNPSCEMWGGNYFTVSQKNIKISIGMFDEKGILVREIYTNDKVTPGQYNVKYAYDCEKYTDKNYYFKTIRNDKVLLTVKLSKKG